MPRFPPASNERLRREAADWLARMHGPESEERAGEFRAWYEADEAHSEAYDRLSRHWDQAGLLAASQVGRSRSLPPRASRPAWRPGYALAAALVAAVGLTLALASREQPSSVSAPGERLLFATAVGEIRELPLPDGSRVTLDTDSALGVEFGPRERRVTLSKGRARFAVTGGGRAFLVAAGDTLVTAERSVFDIDLLPQGTTIVSLQGPAVSVAARESGGAEPGWAAVRTGQKLILAPGQGTRLTGASKADRVWPSGMLDFDATPLSEAIGRANRYSRRKMRLADPGLAGLRVTGAFRIGDPVGLARSLAAAFDLRLEETADGHLSLGRKP